MLALLILSLFLAWLLQRFGVGQLAVLDSDPAQYVQHKRHVYHASYLSLLVGFIVLGGLYLCLVEAVAYIIRLCFFSSPRINAL